METEQQLEGKGPAAAAARSDRAETLARIEAALKGLRFGTVTLVVHEGEVVVVERTEKVRITRA
jgi:hypothetical protein